MINFVSKTEIHKGWSGDRKFCAVDRDGNKYLLRISPIEKADRKKAEYAMAKEVASLGIPMCSPVDFWVCEDGVYSVYSWIDGEDARDALPFCTDAELYAYGAEAGRIQRILHSIPAPKDLPDWEERYNKKLDTKLEKYRSCPLKYEKGDLLVKFVDSNRHLLANRPLTYQHGDYHVGNMMIGKDKKLYIIDFFDRNDFGDPWEDIKPITWDVAVSPVFAKGRIDGYFDRKIPQNFWSLLALYVTAGILSSLPWAIPFGDGEVEIMRKLAADVLDWYDDMSCVVPKWYRTDFN